MSITNLIENLTKEFVCDEINKEMLNRAIVAQKDSSYLSLIESKLNGGFFYTKSLQFYSFSTRDNYNNIELINKILKEKFRGILNDEIAFSQEIFGNQFMFDNNSGRVIFFNIETGEKDVVADNFSEWLQVLLNDIDYYTGRKITESWLQSKTLNFNERLCPKIPFILGGDYVIDNLYASPFPNFISSNANIATQVYNLPDGSKFKIKIQNSDRFKDEN